MKQFQNRVAVVTGGSTGIGRAAAIELARGGASVVIASRNAENGRKTAEEINRSGGRAEFIRTDVTSESDVEKLVKETVSVFGRLDMAFNNAGIEQVPLALHEQSEKLFNEVIDTNVKGVWLCLKHQIPAMLKTGGGSIVNTSSFSGTIAFATIPIYVASKHAVVGLTKAVALEYAGRNIRVNAILPGAVENTGTFERSFGGDSKAVEAVREIHPMKRLATPDEIASSVLFLLSDKSGFITGHSMIADGGYTAG